MSGAVRWPRSMKPICWLDGCSVIAAGVVVETMLVDDDQASTNFEFQRMTTAQTRKKQVKRVVEYGSYIPALARLLEEGYFE